MTLTKCVLATRAGRDTPHDKQVSSLEGQVDYASTPGSFAWLEQQLPFFVIERLLLTYGMFPVPDAMASTGTFSSVMANPSPVLPCHQMSRSSVLQMVCNSIKEFVSGLQASICVSVSAFWFW